MKIQINPCRLFAVALFAGSTLSANPLFWNPNPLGDDWGNTVWAETSGGAPTLTWTSGAAAVFDQAGTYTATLSTDQTADALNITAGAVTLSGSLLSSNSINIAAGASLTAAGNTLLKVGTTTLTVDGSWTLSSGATSTSARVSLAGGSGTIIANGNLRTSGNFNFAGNISGSGGIFTDAAGTFTLGGNNSYNGNTLFRHGNTIRLNSTNAISPTSWLRFGAGTNIVELAAADFSRTLGTAAGQVRFHHSTDGAGNSGFAAIGANRNVAINGTVVWGGGSFEPGVFHLGTAASTHTVTLTTGIDLGAGTRIISTANGSSSAGGRVSGSLTNGTLQVQGTGALILSGNNNLVTINKGASGSDSGTLILSGSNTFSNTILNFGTNSENRGAIRLEHDNALGGITDINGNYTGTPIAQIQLANNVTISSINYAVGGRSNATTSGSALVNVSGNNTWAGTLRIANTGGGYGIRSDAGTLTISGELRNGLGTARTWELTGSGDIDITGNIVNGGAFALSLLKSGTGTLDITGNSNTYSGGTTLTTGRLMLNNTSGSGLGSGAATVNGGTLGGTGSFSGAATINTTGVLSPGTSVGTLGMGALTLNTGSTLLYELNTTAVTGDLLNVNGNLDLVGTVTLSLADLGSADLLGIGTKFNLISYAGTWNGFEFNGYADDSTFTAFGNEWLINYNDVSVGAVNGGLYANAVTLTVIPEPAAALLGGLGLLVLLRRRRS